MRPPYRHVLACSVVVLGACASSHDSPYPYAPKTTNVIGASNSSVGKSGGAGLGGSVPTSSTQVGIAGNAPEPTDTFTTATPSGDACLMVKDQCIRPGKTCGADATADVIVYENGAVLSTICYPNRDYKVITVGDAPVSAAPLMNNSVIVLDDKADGVDVTGDVTITGNNVIVYGHGPDVSVIGGNLNIDKNNAIVRGVTIDGNVEISKNNASLVDCVIKGDLTITGNNVNLALCQIWGNVTVEGENAVFVSNVVLGDQPISGKNLRCNDDYYFADGNMDGVFQKTEATTAIVCDSQGTSSTTTTAKKP